MPSRTILIACECGTEYRILAPGVVVDGGRYGISGEARPAGCPKCGLIPAQTEPAPLDATLDVDMRHFTKKGWR